MAECIQMQINFVCYNFKDMTKSIFVVFVLLALATFGSAKWVPTQHAYTPQVSA
jgi:hypothetical protein